MPRRTAGRLALLLALALFAAPVWAGERAPRHAAPPKITNALTRLWTALVQRLPFMSSETTSTDPDRSASLDPWG